MTTDDERREVARRLRGAVGHPIDMGQLAEILGFHRVSWSAGMLADRIADLIEPERRKCIRCGKEYEPTNPDQKYCSKQCKRMYHVERRLEEDDLPYWMAQVHGLCGNDEGGANDADRR